jgi:metal-responsive CopG/Arc/MetJ family transcriptional regulator
MKKTSLEIEDALAAELESAAKAHGISTREFIRGALRQALEDSSGSVNRTRFVQRVHDFGTHIESPWTILVDIESEEHFRKYSRK